MEDGDLSLQKATAESLLKVQAEARHEALLSLMKGKCDGESCYLEIHAGGWRYGESGLGFDVVASL